MKFQVLDWDSYHEPDPDNEDEHELLLYKIRIYGRTEEGKTVYVQVDDFTPHFYLEIPRTWRNEKIKRFVNDVKKKVWKKFQNSLKSYSVVSKCKFYGFTNYQPANFIRFVFYSQVGMKKFESVFWDYKECRPKPFHSYNVSRRPQIYKLYESNIEPLIRCMHIRDLEACGWINVKKFFSFVDYEKPTICDINIRTKWTNLEKADDSTILPFIIASFDIECTSQDGSFPQADRDGDKIIQIGTTFNRFGEDECYFKHIITLGTCDPIEGVEVESYDSEKEVLVAWTEMIKRINPDIITGYNIFGFDYKYMFDRSKKLGCQHRFSRLCRTLNTDSTKLVEKKLSSSALGDNNLYYMGMKGRVQVDMYKVIQSNFNLSSYKLDSVASHFFQEKISEIMIDEDENQSTVLTNNTHGMKEGQFITLIINDGISDTRYRDGAKFQIANLDKSSITIKGLLDGDVLKTKEYNIVWCQAKDDLPPKEIFRMQKGSSADRATIAKYCIQDCALCNKLMDKLKIVANNVGMANVCSVPMSYLFLRGQGVKIFSLVAKVCRLKNHLIPLVKRKYEDPDDEKKNNADKAAVKLERAIMGLNDDDDDDVDPYDGVGYEGATVLTPESGVYYFPIPVLDFASLYPRSMIHRNLSHECLVQDKKYDNLPGYIYHTVEFRNPDGTVTVCRYAQKKDGSLGILPEILKYLLDQRTRIKGLMKGTNDPFMKGIYDGLQLAYKLVANSLYGQTGAKTSPIYLRPIAASTTSTGRFMLNAARLFAEYVFPILVKPALIGNEEEFNLKMDQLFDKQVDDLLGPKLVKKLKKNKEIKQDNLETYLCDQEEDVFEKKEEHGDDYKYMCVFKERMFDLTDDKFDTKETRKLGCTTRDLFKKYVYDEIRSLLDGMEIEPYCIYGDTDSIFVSYEIMDRVTKEKLSGQHILEIAIKLGVLTGDIINFVLPYPHNLEYEKTFYPFTILSKKRYVGHLFELDPNKYYQKSMGIVLKRRDNAPIVKLVYGGMIECIMKQRDTEKAIQFIRDTLQNILDGKYPLDKFIITKTLKENYKDRTRMAHVVLADRMAVRDPGNKPQSNDRIPYAYIMVDGLVKLDGERVEHPEFIVEKGLKLDYLHYITNQIMKPVVQVLELLVKNPERIFKEYIAKETARRQGKKSLDTYFGDGGDSDEEFEDIDQQCKTIKVSERQIIKKIAKKSSKKKSSKKNKQVKQSSAYDDEWFN